MKFIRQFFLIIAIAFLASCKCDETQSCDGVSAEGRILLPANIGGATYRSASGETINILLRMNEIQEATEEDCDNGSNECECGECPNRIGRITYGLTPFPTSSVVKTSIQGGTFRGGVFFANDTCIFRTITRNEEVYTITVEEVSSSNTSLELEFLGFSYAFNVERQGGVYSLASNEQDPEVELLSTFTTPEESYENILVLNREASRISSQSQHLSKIYYSTNEGVIAYESLQSELFYLVK